MKLNLRPVVAGLKPSANTGIRRRGSLMNFALDDLVISLRHNSKDFLNRNMK